VSSETRHPTSRPEAAQAPESADVITSSLAQLVRRRVGLVVVIAIVVLTAIVLLLLRSSADASADPLAATNPAPVGARALVQVLEQRGVHVIATDSLSQTRAAITDSADTTVMLYDPSGFLTSEQHRALLEKGTDIVAVQPELLAVGDLIPSAALTGSLSGTFHADCSVQAVQKAGTVTASGVGHRVTGDGSPVTACLTSSSGSGLVQTASDGRTITVLGLGSALQNGTVATRGDAALALNLLGAHRTLIWYVSSYADLQSVGATATIAELTPVWVTPLLALLALAGLAGLFWRGRRFGPVVIENLPVVVRASETMEGRARLYARANARLRALDALRIGTVDRLARSAGLPRAASVDQVIDAIAALLGRDRSDIALTLLDRVPSNDAELVQLSDQLLALEAEVAKALRR
jgi:hypothetical protein